MRSGQSEQKRGAAWACTRPVAAVEATGSTGAPTADLPSGVLFWRLRGRSGTTTGLPTSPTWQFNVGARSASADSSWGATPDFNGDGFSDVVVGAPGGPMGPGPGHVYIYTGSSSGAPVTASTTLTGTVAPGNFGGAVATAGDVNGDGFVDLIVGARGVAAYVYLGSTAGPASTPASTLTGRSAAADFFGQAVAGIGDVNRDGYADVAVGATLTGGGRGSIFVYLGSASGPSASYTVFTSPTGSFLAFGASIASAGDVNGDSYADVLVASRNGTASSEANLLLGGAAGLSHSTSLTVFGAQTVATAGDVNGDGLSDILTAGGGVGVAVRLGSATAVSTIPALTLMPPEGADFGASIAGARDVNGDGLSDVVVGAPGVGSGEGRTYVYLGVLGDTAVSTMPMPLRNPSGTLARFGAAVAGAGDIDGDGFADVLVGAPVGVSNVGRAYVFGGSAIGVMSTPATEVVDPGGAGGQFGLSVE